MRLIPLLALPLALVLSSCGGGGGGGGGSTPPPDVTVSLNATNVSGFTNTPVVLTATTSNGSAVSWSTSGGTLANNGPNSVRFTATATGTYTVTATSTQNNAKFAKATIKVVSNSLAVVRGTIKSGSTGVGGVGIRLHNAAGTVLATGSTSANGSFSIAVSPTAKLISINGDLIPANYYQSWSYSGEWFTAIGVACRGELPVLTAGTQTSSLAIGLLATASPPPPPPTGCK